MNRKLKSALLLAALLLLTACGGRNPGKSADTPRKSREFPSAGPVPSVITDPKESYEYMIQNFWSRFLDPSTSFLCDSTHVNGVPDTDVESAIGMYVTLLGKSPDKAFAVSAMGSFFSEVEKYQKANPSSNLYSYMEKTVTKYLYDPNSPVRDEDLYLPYVEGLAASPLTDPGMVPAYSYDASMCALNRHGTPAADFAFTDLEGRKHTLYGVKADNVLLFFSNPGCPACGEIVEALCSDEAIASMVASGCLAVISIYIDSELDKWREYASAYPKQWISGYDHTGTIRSDVIYNVRAIPSLYLLDSGKKVVLKDAPVEKVIGYLHGIKQN
ncbi:MAG: DUF5106 domain-containing protein [Candidatus Cryptobacteroides sp.]